MILIDFLELMAKLNLCEKDVNPTDEIELSYEFKDNQGNFNFDNKILGCIPDNWVINVYEHDQGTSVYFEKRLNKVGDK